MRNLTAICTFILGLHSFGQQVTVVDRKHFKIDSAEFSVATLKNVREVTVPFVHGGDGRFARKSQLSFKLRNAASVCMAFGDSLYIQWLLSFRQNAPEYYVFSDSLSWSGGRTAYTYAYTGDPKNQVYIAIVDSFVLEGRNYFVWVDTELKDLEETLNLIRELQDLIR